MFGSILNASICLTFIEDKNFFFGIRTEKNNFDFHIMRKYSRLLINVLNSKTQKYLKWANAILYKIITMNTYKKPYIIF